jgi:aspartyl-tRNA(Asn)/glutamyl-tRNA(Gln) amidotransferase subunit C
MAHLDKKLIKKLTELCRIQCSEDEQDELLKDLEQILGYIEQLQEVSTENIPPCNNILEGMANVMRADEIGEPLARQLFLDNAPSQIGGMIRVPPVIKQAS